MKKTYAIGSNKVNILLEEEADCYSLEGLKKYFEKDQITKDNFIKIRHVDEGYYVEFLPLSKEGKKFFIDYIYGDSFGEPKVTKNFFKSINTFIEVGS